MKKLLTGVLAVVLVLGGALFALLRPWPCPVNRAACERVEQGMSRAEVEKILGGPAGDYRTRPAGGHLEEWDSPRRGVVNCIPPIDGVLGFYVEVWQWRGDEGNVQVSFLREPALGLPAGAVFVASFEQATPSNRDPVGLIRWRLRWLKERLLP
jgi:hypothetical protein